MKNNLEDKKTNISLLVLILLVGFVLGYGFHLVFFSSSFLSAPSTVLSTIFSPDAEFEFVSLLSEAKQSIDIEVYTFSSDEITDQLINAKNRGVNVRVIIEKRVQSKTNEETFERLKKAGIEVRWASEEFKLTHSKFIIIDGKKVLVGSHNLSDAALNSNREASVIIIGDKVKEFVSVFEEDWVLAL